MSPTRLILEIHHPNKYLQAVLDLEDVLDDNDGNMTAEDPSIEQVTYFIPQLVAILLKWYPADHESTHSPGCPGKSDI